MFKHLLPYLLLSCLVMTTGPSWATDPELHIGVLAYRSKDFTLKNWKPIADRLSFELDYNVSVHAMNEEELEQALVNSELDVVITNPADYIYLNRLGYLGPAVVTHLNHTHGGNTSAYGGVIFSRSDNSKINNLSDVSTAKIAISDTSSFSGYLVQAYQLKTAGLTLPLPNQLLSTAGSQDAIVQRVLNGEAEVGFVRSSVIEDMAKEGLLDISAIKIINQQKFKGYPVAVSTQLYPEWPVALTPKINDKLGQHLTIGLLSLHAHDFQHTHASSSGSTQHIHGFGTPQNYAGVEHLLKTLRVKPYNVSPKVHWRDIWQTYRLWLIALGILLIVVAATTVRLMIQGNRLRENQTKTKLAQQQLEYVIDGAQLGYWDWHYQSGEHFVNQRWMEMLGINEQDINNNVSDWDARIHPEDKQRVIDHIQQHIAEKKGYVVDFRMRHHDGHWVWIQGSGAVVEYDPITQKPLRLTGTHQDISERKQAEEQIKLSAQVFSHSSEAILISDKNHRTIDINPAFTALTGFTHNDVYDKDIDTLSSQVENAELNKTIRKGIQKYGFWQGERWRVKKNGETYAEYISITCVNDDSGNPISHINLSRDITQLKRHQETLELIANYDPLTQLPNRNLFTDRFNQAIAHSNRTQLKLAICFLDLDNFKPINDNFGHDVGDRVLIEIARRIQLNIREEDTVSRQGGDEFALLLNDIDNFSECEQTLERIHKSIAETIVIDDIPHHVTASSGVTLYPIDHGDIDTLLRHADHAMYESKQSGRNRFHMFNSELDKALSDQMQMLQNIEQALENEEMVLFYQPKVNMVTGEIYGAEALLRWLDPNKGLIPPLDFLPALEGTDLEIKLGDWVIDQALQQLQQWQKQHIQLQLSVNIASHHLRSPIFIASLEKSLARHHAVKPKYLELEILESSALGDLDAVAQLLKTCISDLGVSVALDDFGTGYSSLTHLRHLPVNTIKIDQTFVRDMLVDKNDHLIVESIIGLSGSFGHNVLAEGVESTKQGIELINMGCNAAQGYGISKPLPLAEFTAWLENYQPNPAWLTARSERH